MSNFPACGYGGVRAKICPTCRTDIHQYRRDRDEELLATASQFKIISVPLGIAGGLFGAWVGFEIGGIVGAILAMLVIGTISYMYAVPAFVLICIIIVIALLAYKIDK